MNNDIKMLIAFMAIFIIIIGGIVLLETSKDVTSDEPIISEENEENKELIKPNKYQEIGENYPIATITMSDNRIIKIELYPNIAPTTVENFIELVNSGFYNGITFHRASKGFVIQGGDPNGNGTGGPGYSIVGEFLQNGYQNDLTHDIGVISMSRNAYDYNSAGSQFFIVTSENAKLSLDGLYAGFGKVIEGMEVVTEIENLDTDNEIIINKPVIKNITVDTKGVTYDSPEKIVE